MQAKGEHVATKVAPLSSAPLSSFSTLDAFLHALKKRLRWAYTAHARRSAKQAMYTAHLQTCFPADTGIPCTASNFASPM
jgi:predicted  nucleic acid-binding Zn ribbon protein